MIEPEIIRRAEEIPGWMTRNELAWLSCTASALDIGATWLEIGAFCGRSTFAVGMSLPLFSMLHVCDKFADFVLTDTAFIGLDWCVASGIRWAISDRRKKEIGK